MWIKLLIDYWREIVMFVMASIIAWLYVHTIPSIEKDLQIATQSLEYQSKIIYSNRAEYESNLAKAKKQAAQVRTKYIEKIKYVDRWRDKNVSCDDAMLVINHYDY